MEIYILSNKNILSNENIFLSNENNFYRMKIYFYPMKIILIEFCYLLATINCDPQLQQNMLNANRTLQGTYEELRNRSLPRMVRAHDVCLHLQRIFFAYSVRFLFAACPSWAIVEYRFHRVCYIGVCYLAECYKLWPSETSSLKFERKILTNGVLYPIGSGISGV